MHFPIDDFNQQEKAVKYFSAAQYLNDLVNNKNLKVYVHDSSGISRSPTVILTYLTIFKRVDCWQNINQSEKYIRQYYPVGHSNTSLVQKIVNDNREFQNK